MLPEAFALDSDRLARFKREAHVLASLNHPNIAAIYGFEEPDGVQALVLELVEGPTLADRIAQGPIPIDEALPIAKQIAEALEAAHEHGIIHRDLKPANIKVRPDGTAKVLDFGLAKLAHPQTTAGHAEVTASPTITSPAMMTGVGVILGTAAYMAPEQAKGREADKRSDIWAFGCVLYEMLTGRRPFDGEDVSDTLANVLKIDPDWSALPSEVPPAIRTLLQSCLTKDRRRRVADISTVLFVLEKGASLAPPAGTVSATVLPRRPLWRRVAALTAGALVVAAVATTLTWVATRPAEPVPPRVSRLLLAPSGTAALTINGADRDLAITPDGSRIVYVGTTGTQLFVRALDALEPLAVFKGAPRGPFVSPDGQWVGFVDGTSLKKVAMTGGPAVTPASLDGNPRGATWAPDGTIIFATLNATTGLQRVSAAGGTPEVLTRPDLTTRPHYKLPDLSRCGGAIHEGRRDAFGRLSIFCHGRVEAGSDHKMVLVGYDDIRRVNGAARTCDFRVRLPRTAYLPIPVAALRQPTPTTQTPRFEYLLAVLDPNDRELEVEEANNIASTETYRAPRVQLSIVNPLKGQSYPVWATVTNNSLVPDDFVIGLETQLDLSSAHTGGYAQLYRACRRRTL